MKKQDTAMLAMGLTFVFSLLLALLVVPLYPKEYQAFGENTDNPLNPLFYIVMVLLLTAVILYIAKKHLEKLIQWIILGSMWVTMVYVLYPIFYHFYPYVWVQAEVAVFDMNLTVAVMISTILTAALFHYPEWYVIDACGIMVSAGVCAILGMSLSILPVFILLIALAVYDAIAVYKTKHMVSLADSVTELHLPVVLVVPKERGYSYLEQEGIKKEIDKGKEREAMFMGLGDIVIPGTLVVSAFVFLSDATKVFGLSGNLVVALCTMLGGLCGFGVLMHYVNSGRPQAGLPLLNSFAIAGFMVSYYLVYRNLTFGIAKFW